MTGTERIFKEINELGVDKRPLTERDKLYNALTSGDKKYVKWAIGILEERISKSKVEVSSELNVLMEYEQKIDKYGEIRAINTLKDYIPEIKECVSSEEGFGLNSFLKKKEEEKDPRIKKFSKEEKELIMKIEPFNLLKGDCAEKAKDIKDAFNKLDKQLNKCEKEYLLNNLISSCEADDNTDFIDVYEVYFLDKYNFDNRHIIPDHFFYDTVKTEIESKGKNLAVENEEISSHFVELMKNMYNKDWSKEERNSLYNTVKNYIEYGHDPFATSTQMLNPAENFYWIDLCSALNKEYNLWSNESFFEFKEEFCEFLYNANMSKVTPFYSRHIEDIAFFVTVFFRQNQEYYKSLVKKLKDAKGISEDENNLSGICETSAVTDSIVSLINNNLSTPEETEQALIKHIKLNAFDFTEDKHSTLVKDVYNKISVMKSYKNTQSDISLAKIDTEIGEINFVKASEIGRIHRWMSKYLEMIFGKDNVSAYINRTKTYNVENLLVLLRELYISYMIGQRTSTNRLIGAVEEINEKLNAIGFRRLVEEFDVNLINDEDYYKTLKKDVRFDLLAIRYMKTKGFRIK